MINDDGRIGGRRKRSSAEMLELDEQEEWDEWERLEREYAKRIRGWAAVFQQSKGEMRGGDQPFLVSLISIKS